MVERRRTNPEATGTSRRPGTTPEARENQLISLAYDVAEKQMRDGTASAQVITSFLKLGSTRERLEQKRLEHETALLEAKQAQIASGARVEELYEKAIVAMKKYHGDAPVDPDDVYSD